MKRNIKIYLDNESTPLKEFAPPANFTIDTTKIADGDHELKIVATSSNGVEGVKKVPFVVRNGPEIELVGMRNNDVVSDQLDLSVNAYGSESKENFIVSGSETPKAVPAWLWVIVIGFVAWASFYMLTYWS